MGVDDHLLTSTLEALVGHRLVRTLCRGCRRRPHEAAPRPGHPPRARPADRGPADSALGFPGLRRLRRDRVSRADFDPGGAADVRFDPPAGAAPGRSARDRAPRRRPFVWVGKEGHGRTGKHPSDPISSSRAREGPGSRRVPGKLRWTAPGRNVHGLIHWCETPLGNLSPSRGRRGCGRLDAAGNPSSGLGTGMSARSNGDRGCQHSTSIVVPNRSIAAPP
jgi:hypothetical protein